MRRLLVVSARSSRRDHVLRAYEAIRTVSQGPVSIVLNFDRKSPAQKGRLLPTHDAGCA